MDQKNYKLPPVAWLKVTDYMHGWLQRELGSGARIGDQRVVCLQHLPGAREALRMETEEDDQMDVRPVGNAMSATRRNCVALGLALDRETMERFYGVTADQLKLFAPIECPQRCLTRYGVLRDWTNEVSFGHRQAGALQQVIRAGFWEAVGEFNAEYARRQGRSDYPSIEMVEAWCRETGTSEVHAEAIKREWNRRVAREKAKAAADGHG